MKPASKEELDKLLNSAVTHRIHYELSTWGLKEFPQFEHVVMDNISREMAYAIFPSLDLATWEDKNKSINIYDAQVTTIPHASWLRIRGLLKEFYPVRVDQ